MSETQGLRKLRLGIALLIFEQIIESVALLLLFEAILSVLPSSEVLIHGSLYPPVNIQKLLNTTIKSSNFDTFFSLSLLSALLDIIGIIIIITAIIEVIRGFIELKNYVKKSYLGIYGIIIQLISGLAVLFLIKGSSFEFLHLEDLIIVIIESIGYILIGATLYYIGGHYGQDLLKIGGILIMIPFGLIDYSLLMVVSPIPLSIVPYSLILPDLIISISLIFCFLGLNSVYKNIENEE